MNAIVGEVAIWKKPCVTTRAVGKIPAVDFITFVVDQVNNPWAGKSGIESVALGDFLMIDAAEANSSTM